MFEDSSHMCTKLTPKILRNIAVIDTTSLPYPRRWLSEECCASPPSSHWVLAVTSICSRSKTWNPCFVLDVVSSNFIFDMYFSQFPCGFIWHQWKRKPPVSPSSRHSPVGSTRHTSHSWVWVKKKYRFFWSKLSLFCLCLIFLVGSEQSTCWTGWARGWLPTSTCRWRQKLPATKMLHYQMIRWWDV